MAIRVTVKSKKIGKIAEDIYTPKELLEKSEDEIVEELTMCDCEPDGDSLYTDCSCYEEWYDYELTIEEI